MYLLSYMLRDGLGGVVWWGLLVGVLKLCADGHDWGWRIFFLRKVSWESEEEGSLLEVLERL